MLRRFLLLSLSVFWLIPNVATAKQVLELRLGGSITANSPDALNEQLQNLDLEAKSLSGWNLDAFVNIPLLPIGAGLRYERSTQDQSSSEGSYELKVQDLALLVDWRILDNALFYLGPLLSLGYPSGEFQLADFDSQSIDPDKVSVALAAEGGVYLGSFLIGAELGYKSVKLEPPGFLDLVPELDLSGFYGRLQVGVGFF